MRKERVEAWLKKDGLLRVMGWAREGLTDGQIAERIGIGAPTLKRWREAHPEIGAAIEQGRAPVDVEAENALLRAALGYTLTVKKPYKVKEVSTRTGEGRTEVEHIEYAEEEVHVPPRITALIYWLKNRRPDRWRDRPAAGSEAQDDPLAEMLRRWEEE